MSKEIAKPLYSLLTGEHDCFWVWFPHREAWEIIIINKETDGEYHFFCRAGNFSMGEKFKNLLALPIEKPVDFP